jgi:hypothetical protein
MPLAFESWDLALEPLAERSRFYALPPIGLGTPLVESLSGYVVRLAEAHAVSAGSLVGKGLSNSVSPGDINLGNVSYAINGIGESAKRWIRALETMTSCSDIRYLTLLPFERLFPKPFLFRQVRAWCPTCYELTASRAEQLYEQLLWCLKLVEVCSRHRAFLTTTCPHCLRSQRPLSATSRPGFCSRCGLWLGDERTQKAPRLSDAAPTDYQLWLADAIGDLLANAAGFNQNMFETVSVAPLLHMPMRSRKAIALQSRTSPGAGEARFIAGSKVIRCHGSTRCCERGISSGFQSHACWKMTIQSYPRAHR